MSRHKCCTFMLDSQRTSEGVLRIFGNQRWPRKALLNVLMKGSSKMKKFMFLFLVLCIGLAVSPTMAQDLSTTGSIRGKVIDSNGAAVPGATVTVEGGIGQRSTIANSDGVFEVQ